ncbi:hypothetical protein B566_EDAN006850 [Ephemera danica]|nr:hypothetical protein B566_EDAN006850 [Ephemera danica]
MPTAVLACLLGSRGRKKVNDPQRGRWSSRRQQRESERTRKVGAIAASFQVARSTFSCRQHLEILPPEVKEVPAASAVQTSSSSSKRARVQELAADVMTTEAFNAAAAYLNEQYLYAANWYHNPWARLPPSSSSTFRPWNAPLFSKDANLRDLPQFLTSQRPPVLLHPERVVPLSESERFERQPNVALAPATQQYLLQKPPSYPEVKKEDEVGARDDCTKSSSVPTLLPRPPSLRPAYNPEIELSSDTEDSSSLAERCSDRGGGVGEAETTELLEQLARCVASCSADDQEEVRVQGERALRTLGVDLLSSREARNVLAVENQMLREKLVQLEDRLKMVTSVRTKELEVTEDRRPGLEVSKSREKLEHRSESRASSAQSLHSPPSRSPIASVITSAAAVAAASSLSSRSSSISPPPVCSIKAEPVN